MDSIRRKIKLSHILNKSYIEKSMKDIFGKEYLDYTNVYYLSNDYKHCLMFGKDKDNLFLFINTSVDVVFHRFPLKLSKQKKLIEYINTVYDLKIKNAEFYGDYFNQEFTYFDKLVQLN